MSRSDTTQQASVSDVPIRPASTVVVVRRISGKSAGRAPASGENQSSETYEVFMVRRNPRSEFVGGAFVFPGGAVDASDADLARFVYDLDDTEASGLLGLESGGLAWLTAAARELFEEAGMLLAVEPSGKPIDPGSDRALAEQLIEGRRRLNSKSSTLAEILDELGLYLDVRRLHFFAHWITPPGQPRRYDTRFFLCEMPSGQDPVHEGEETTDSLWISPTSALRAASEGKMTIIFPTLKNLERLASFETIEELIAWAKDHRPETVRPRVKIDAGAVSILIPGDEGYEDAQEIS